MPNTTETKIYTPATSTSTRPRPKLLRLGLVLSLLTMLMFSMVGCDGKGGCTANPFNWSCSSASQPDDEDKDKDGDTTPPPTPTAYPMNPTVLTPKDVYRACQEQWFADDTVVVGPDLGSDGTMVVPLCGPHLVLGNTAAFQAKPDRRVTKDGNYLRIADGNVSKSVYVGPARANPGAAGQITLGSKYPKKTGGLYAHYKGRMIKLGPASLIVHIGPSGSPSEKGGPGSPTVWECKDYKEAYPERPADEFFADVWDECKYGGAENEKSAKKKLNYLPTRLPAGVDPALYRAMHARLERVEQKQGQMKKNWPQNNKRGNHPSSQGY
jgi:hypothetical protein